MPTEVEPEIDGTDDRSLFNSYGIAVPGGELFVVVVCRDECHAPILKGDVPLGVVVIIQSFHSPQTTYPYTIHLINKSTHTTIANPDWISQAFIDDDFVKDCEAHQDRPFLRTTVVPTIGHRVELTVFLKDRTKRRLPFRLSGEVVGVGPLPVINVDG